MSVTEPAEETPNETPESEAALHEELVPTDEPSELDLAIAERDQAKDDYLRTLAEFQNFRRRAQQEKHDLQKWAAQDLIADLLPVLDNFERTLAAAEAGASVESLVEGVRAVDRQVKAILERRHLKRIVAVGMPFDPVIHEPIGTDSIDGVAADTVTVEVEPGYMLGDRVLRPARVRVAKGS